MTSSAAPRIPAGLAAAGKRLWSSVVPAYPLRPDEVVVLEKACRTADDLARIDAAVRKEPLLSRGSMGQHRANPLLAEARGMRALLASLLKQLALADPEVGAKQRVDGARKAARARWPTSAPRWPTATAADLEALYGAHNDLEDYRDL